MRYRNEDVRISRRFWVPTFSTENSTAAWGSLKHLNSETGFVAYEVNNLF